VGAGGLKQKTRNKKQEMKNGEPGRAGFAPPGKTAQTGSIAPLLEIFWY